jgi:DNA-binding transcriptional MerR regulator
MKLTIEQVSELTKLSVPTLRVYASRQNLGTKVGKSRVFSQADVQKLLKNTKPSSGAAKAKQKAKPKGKAKAATVRTARKPRKVAAAKKVAVKKQVATAKVELPIAKTATGSLWNRLFGNRRTTQKVSLLSVKTTK